MNNRIKLCITLSIVLFGVTACATGGSARTGKDNSVLHTFSFNSNNDNSDSEVLDFFYGSHVKGLHPSAARVRNGAPYSSYGVYGRIPKGEILFVKWRIKSTGNVYEERADLTARLPEDLENLNVHFVVSGEKLFVHVLWPYDGTRYPPGPIKNTSQKQVQIYPDN